MRNQVTVGLFAVIVVLISGGRGYAQEGVTIITQTRAAAGDVTLGDAPGFPVTISEGGSYRLDSNLEVPDSNTTGIEITASNVAVDLNGFSILGPGIPGSGIGISARGPGPVPAAPATVIAVRNGMVRGMGSTGIGLHRSCRVEGLHVIGNGAGISANVGCTVINNVVNVNQGVAIRVLGGTVIGNTVTANTGLGLELGVADPAPNEIGIVVGYANNVLTDNNGGNANPQVTGGLQMGVNICGTRHCRP